VIEADDKAISDLLLDSKVVLFAEGKAAESLLDVKPGNMVIVEAQTAYGIIRVKTPYYGFQLVGRGLLLAMKKTKRSYSASI
jgi:hypothetical protein